MGSPGVFIHSGILGGRLSAFSPAARALPARPPARTAPPINALPSRRKRRRDRTAGSLSASVGSVIVHPQFESAHLGNRCRQILRKDAFPGSDNVNGAGPRLVPSPDDAIRPIDHTLKSLA